MSYTVLARKFRSRTFDEIVGQRAITATLKNAITQDRIHHGYLFCGTRGVGKTSMARILAKALNCHAAEGPTIEPCGECDSCVNVARGEDVDVVEIDAASNTGVDNIRELRTNAVYRPARSRFKVYIIDEVHMLSTGAFNALLKTLEEPPAHVKFIFATTEANKVPATILSRVQRFDFSSIPADEIGEQLAMICESEGVTIEDAARKRLARLANGSMRDALSLLDQVLSMAGDQVTGAVVDELLPAAHNELFAELIDRLAANDPGGALTVVDRSLGQGQTLDTWCSLLINQIRDLMVMRVCGEETDLVDVPSDLRPKLVEQCKQFDGGAFTYMITVLEELRRSVKSSGGGRALVEAAIIRLAEASSFSSIESLLAQVQGGGAPAAAPRIKKNVSQPVASPATPIAAPPAARSAKIPPGGEGAKSPRQAAPSSAPAKQPASHRQPTQWRSIRRTTQDDLKTAETDPTVKQALNLFGGSIVEVQHAPKAAATEDMPDQASGDETED